MEWIGCNVCETFAFKLYCDLETGVWGHSRSLKVTPLDRPTPRTSYKNQRSCRSVKRLRSYGHCISKMAVSRHLGFYRTANSAIRSADPENPSLEPNMEWKQKLLSVYSKWPFYLWRQKKHPLAFSVISQWKMFRFIQNFQLCLWVIRHSIAVKIKYSLLLLTRKHFIKCLSSIVKPIISQTRKHDVRITSSVAKNI